MTKFIGRLADIGIAKEAVRGSAESSVDFYLPKVSLSIGSLDAADILNKQFSVEGSLEIVFNDNTFKTEMLGDTANAMRLRLTNSDVTIGSSLNPQLTIDLAKAKFSNFERNYENDGIVAATVDCKAFYGLADTAMTRRERFGGSKGSRQTSNSLVRFAYEPPVRYLAPAPSEVPPLPLCR